MLRILITSKGTSCRQDGTWYCKAFKRWKMIFEPGTWLLAVSRRGSRGFKPWIRPRPWGLGSHLRLRLLSNGSVWWSDKAQTVHQHNKILLYIQFYNMDPNVTWLHLIELISFLDIIPFVLSTKHSDEVGSQTEFGKCHSLNRVLWSIHHPVLQQILKEFVEKSHQFQLKTSIE